MTKIIAEDFPRSRDPYELLFSGPNCEMLEDYARAKQFMSKIIAIEKDFHSSAFVRSLRDFEQLQVVSRNKNERQQRKDDETNSVEEKKDQRLVAKIEQQSKQFFKVYYRSILRGKQESRGLREVLVKLIETLDFEFHLKDVPFLKFVENVRRSALTEEECPQFIRSWTKDTDE